MSIKTDSQHHRFAFSAMGTPCEIQLYAASDAQAQAVAAAVIDDVRRLEKRYSRYQPDSFLSQINRVAALGGEIEIDPETAALLNYANQCYQDSDQLFDISSGLLRKAWKFNQNTLPDSELITSLLQRVGWDKIVWNRERIRFLIPGMELDFGGIVKEYAVDRAATLCHARHIEHAVINLGGDVKVVGPRPDGSPWSIGIKHPSAGRIDHAVEIYQGAIASSGDYERYIEIDGCRYGHILNPKTGWPVSYLSAVTVIDQFCVVAGSVSTIAMLKEQAGIPWLEALGLHHLWVSQTGLSGGKLAG